jgi:methyltransferase family protein
MSLGLRSDVLRFINDLISPESRTLETGEGLSTVLFALRGTTHTCVGPDFYVHDSIRQFCERQGISLENVTFEVGFSEDVLPRLERTPLDLVLIDGGHGFPITFVDWLYTGDRLRVGGHLVIDDIEVWTGSVLTRFLAAEPQWELVKEFTPRAVVFRKASADEHLVKDWTEQPFVVTASRQLNRKRRAKRAMSMLAHGDFRELSAHLRAYVRRRPFI